MGFAFFSLSFSRILDPTKNAKHWFDHVYGLIMGEQTVVIFPLASAEVGAPDGLKGRFKRNVTQSIWWTFVCSKRTPASPFSRFDMVEREGAGQQMPPQTTAYGPDTAHPPPTLSPRVVADAKLGIG
jgi:hypothetical protein